MITIEEYIEDILIVGINSERVSLNEADEIKKFFDQHCDLKEKISNPSYTADRNTVELIKTIIYSGWNNNWWQPNKHANDFYWGEIPWFYLNVNELAVQNSDRLLLAYFAEVKKIYSHVSSEQNNCTEIDQDKPSLPVNYSRFYKFA